MMSATDFLFRSLHALLNPGLDLYGGLGVHGGAFPPFFARILL